MKTKSINTALIAKESTIIIGLSGGPDSVYLLHQLAALKESGHAVELIAAHLDHEWRPESGRDREFCAQIAATYGIPFVAQKMSELSHTARWNGSQEEIGRKARQYFLARVMREHNADAIALGHHADDQQETFFIRLIRGSSLTGLCGMLPKSGHYIRPLLELSKSEIIQFLETHKIPYLTDPTNVSPDYLRNRIRTSVLPALRACDDRFDRTLLATMGRLQQAEEYMQATAQQIFETMATRDGETITINTRLLLDQPAIMQHRLLMIWLTTARVRFTPTSAFLDEIVKFLASPAGGTHMVGADWQISKKQRLATIVLSPRSSRVITQ